MPSYQKNAFLLTCMILCLALLCALWLVISYAHDDSDVSGRIADIYQDGELIMSLPLDPDAEPRTFTVTAGEEDFNEIRIIDGHIGVISASCPDKLCIRQSLQNNSLLPIICLPNKLVIQIREEDNITTDIIAY